VWSIVLKKGRMENIILQLEKELASSFGEVEAYFDCPSNVLEYIPTNKGWMIKQVLEHITLTNHFLLILVKKGVEKSLALSQKKDAAFSWEGYTFNWGKLTAIGQHNAFLWNRPEHMKPTGKLSLDEVKVKLRNQLVQCLDLLAQIKNGEGMLYKTMMSVNDLGKIDVYHYIYFIVQHTRRHVQQMEKIKSEITHENNHTTNT
jgi:hypothetical protein